MAKAGGTSVSEPSAGGGLVAFVLVAPIAAYLVHRISSGDECGWDYGAVGGACRSIILLSVIAGAIAGGLAVSTIRAARADEPRRARTRAVIGVAVVVLATLTARQFQDYRHAGMHTMDDEMCKFVNGRLMTCVRNEWGEDAQKLVRRSQDGCLADDKAIETYRRCMPITDCSALLDCVSDRPAKPGS